MCVIGELKDLVINCVEENGCGQSCAANKAYKCATQEKLNSSTTDGNQIKTPVKFLKLNRC